ncbi:MAG: phosphoglycerate kinase [Phycisphaeraceae bacterium]|nr:MAG: phosphoglycerate kinase [Phycisphaeraceae bacterium]
MAKKTIDQIKVHGKRVLMRVDFNVPIDGSDITDDRRIREALPSIRNVVERGGMLILMSHMGRPKGDGFEAEFTLKPCAERLSELVGRPVKFPSKDCIDGDAADAVGAIKEGEIVLLENLRFHKAEKKGDAEFAKKLAAYGDIYCNDAFGTCHRPDASMVAVPRAMEGRPRVCGYLVQKEIKFLAEALEKPDRPYVAILGGAKVSDKIETVERLIIDTDALLIGGAMSYTFLEAMGRKVGKSRVERDHLSTARRLIDLAAKKACDMHLPLDHVCSTEFAERTGTIDVFEDNIPDGFMGMDIGPKSQSEYVRVISSAKTIVWNGPMGVFEWAPFRIGTQQVAQAVADATEGNSALSIVGGGDSAAAVEKFKVADKITHISTGGGASLEMLGGAKFESLELLDEG